MAVGCGQPHTHRHCVITMNNDNNDGVKLVSAAVLGYDAEVVLINGKRYIITPPTIRKILGAGYYLSDVANAETLKDIITDTKNIESIPCALSCLICGDTRLADELKDGTISELTEATCKAFELCDLGGFITLSLLGKNVRKMIANTRQ